MSTRDEFARGWKVLLGATAGNAVGISAVGYTAGLFVEPLEREFGWTRMQISSWSVASMLGLALTNPIVGWLVDRWGPRGVGVFSLSCVATGYLALSRMQSSLEQYLGIFFLMAVLGSGSSPLTLTRAVVSRFDRARGAAIGIALTGISLPAVAGPLLLVPILEARGWRSAYLALAGYVAVVIPLVAATLPVRDASPSAAPAARAGPGEVAEALRSSRFWLIFSCFSCVSLILTGLVVHAVPMLTSLGLPLTQAARAASLLGVSIVVGRLAAGFAVDRLYAPYVGAGVFLIAAAGCIVLCLAGPGWAALAAVMIGVALGTEIDLVAFLVTRFFPLAAYGRIYALVYTGVVVGAGSSPPLIGASFDRFGSYVPALTAGAAGLGLSAALLVLLRHAPGPGGRRRDAPDVPGRPE